MVEAMVPQGRTCTKCGEWKKAAEFFGDKRRKYIGSMRAACRKCTGAVVKSKRADNPEHAQRLERESSARRFHINGPRKRERSGRYKLKWQFGITMEDLIVMLKDQDHGCAICHDKIVATGPGRGSRDLACVDHDHRTDAVRGLLCNRCNTAIGLFKDDPSIVQNATEFLRKHQNESSGRCLQPSAGRYRL